MDMQELDASQLEEAAGVLHRSILWGWPAIEDARQEIKERLIPENTMLAALGEGTVLGWGGILEAGYDGKVKELHPLAVDVPYQRQGIGRILVEALEEAAGKQGALTIFLGADDEKEPPETSLANVDLYHDLPAALSSFEAGSHQAGFYLKMGYSIIGVMPDANGFGKPDIFLGKSLRSEK